MTRIAPATVAEFFAAAVTAAVFARVLPLAPTDPFRSSLVILPLVIAALRGLERRARDLGGRTVGRGAGTVEGVALAALVLLTLHRHRLGLAATEALLAAGYLLLFAHRLARTVVGWRPCLGRSLSPRPPAIFGLLPLVCYLALQPWMSEHRQPDGDEPFYLLLTHSLAFDLDVELTDNYAHKDWQRFMTRPIEPQAGDPVSPGGEVLSRHSPLLPLVLAPAYRFAGRRGAMTMMAALSALLAWMVLRLGSYYAPHRPGAVLLAYAVFAFAPPLLIYSYQIWVEVPAALLLTLALDRVLALRRQRRWPPSQVLALLVPLALLPLLKLRLALLAGALLLLAWLRGRAHPTTMAWSGGGLGVALGSLLAFNAWRFGNPLKIHTWGEVGALGGSPTDYLKGAAGIFYDSAFGLFACAPIWLLLLPGLWLAWRRRSPLPLDAAIVSLPYLIAVWPRLEWYGGWSPPFRYPLALLPLLALLLTPALASRRRPRLRTLAAGLGALTLVLTLIWVVNPGLTYNFADGRTLLLDRAGALVGADVARLFPSTVRPRPATWIWVLASLLLSVLVVGRGRRRGRPTPLWGTLALLAALVAGSLALTRWPTRVVELEDAFVRKEGGSVSPPLWVDNRPFYRGGWTVPRSARLEAPVVAGGEAVTLRLATRLTGKAPQKPLRLAAGETLLTTWTVERGGWQEEVLGTFPWPAGEPLVVLGAGRGTGDEGQIIVDRVDFTWVVAADGGAPP